MVLIKFSTPFRHNQNHGWHENFTTASRNLPNAVEIVLECCCCSAYLSSCYRTASDANLLDDPHTFHYNDYFVIGGIRSCLGVSNDPMFLWNSSNSCPLNLLLVRSHPADIIIAKRLIQGHNSMTRVQVEPRPFDQSRHKNDAFTHSATLPTKVKMGLKPTRLQQVSCIGGQVNAKR